MRNIDGHVCVVMPVGNLERKLLFGKSKNNQPHRYENLQSNGITPYDSVADARQGEKQLKQRKDISSVKLARLRMKLTEINEDSEWFKKKRSLVVVQSEPEQCIFYGPTVKDRPNASTLLGAHIYDNNLTTFKSFADAYRTAQEVHRQGRCPALIGTFKLNYI